MILILVAVGAAHKRYFISPFFMPKAGDFRYILRMVTDRIEGGNGMAKYVMALDAGTTSNRCILFNEAGEICSMAQKEFRQFFPNPGWVEHDANEIWSSMLGVAVEAMNMIRATAADIAAIGITNQRETAIVWNKETGEPVYNAIVWQCRRTSDIADALKKKGLEERYRQKTGLIIDAYFSATKIKWILENVAGARELADEGKLLFGTVETWLIWKLTKGAVHVTDYSNASRTMLFNINELCWDEEILEELGIPASCSRLRCRPVRSTAIQTRHFWGMQSRLRVLRAISRQLFLVRPVFVRVRQRILTAQDAFF